MRPMRLRHADIAPAHLEARALYEHIAGFSRVPLPEPSPIKALDARS